jgi:glycosyltransferase involved in cell wall biosynthesis
MVLPSREEAFGIVLIEAMACKAPVVACKVGGIPEVIEHGQSGLLVEPEDPEALTAGLYRVLTDSALRETISENGYARVMRRFRSSHNGAAYLEAFRSLLDGEKTSPQPAPIPATSPDGDARATN